MGLPWWSAAATASLSGQETKILRPVSWNQKEKKKIILMSIKCADLFPDLCHLSSLTVPETEVEEPCWTAYHCHGSGGGGNLSAAGSSLAR